MNDLNNGDEAMEMAFEDFAVAPARSLTAAQERRLNHRHCTGDFGRGTFSTIKSLIAAGYVEGDGALTEKAAHYIFHYGPQMPV